MKNILFICALFICFSSCHEESPVTPLAEIGETTEPLMPEDKKVVIEEFTGVRCVNCPEGAAAIEDLLNIHGERLIAISIHAGSFAIPYTGQEDYKTETGSDLLNLLGGEIAFPAASIDRKIFEGEDNQQTRRSAWPVYINQQLALEAPVTLDIENTYDETSRQLDVNVSGGAITAVSDALYLSVLITEDDITGPQLTPDGTQNDYTHKHVFREMLTNTAGDALAISGLAAEETFEQDYSFTLPDHWVVENCKVVALVHLGGTASGILQADEVAILK